jgi:hypothetical protein
MKRWTEWSSVPYEERVLTRALRSRAYYSGAGESWAYLSDLDSRLLSLLSAGDKDDEAVDLGHSVSFSARLGNGDVVLLANFYWLGSLRPKTST